MESTFLLLPCSPPIQVDHIDDDEAESEAEIDTSTDFAEEGPGVLYPALTVSDELLGMFQPVCPISAPDRSSRSRFQRNYGFQGLTGWPSCRR